MSSAPEKKQAKRLVTAEPRSKGTATPTARAGPQPVRGAAAVPAVEAGVRRQLRQPRLSELVAEELRRRILALELPDGSLLPKQDDLLREFGVSVPSLREALRILETEGFITVQRGSVGGAVVHLPQASDAAYTFGLVLESRHASLDDVMAALSWLEPICAARCAERPDRRRTVLRVLRPIVAESEQLIDDPVAYGIASRRFHDELVSACGNESVRLVVGALESLWAGQIGGLRLSGDAGVLPDRAERLQTLGEHHQLLSAIDDGDADRAEALARQHFSHRRRQEIYAGRGIAVRAALQRG